MDAYPTQPVPPPDLVPSGSQPIQPPTEPWRPPSQPLTSPYSLPPFPSPSQPFYPPPPARRSSRGWIIAFLIVLFLLPITASGAYVAGYNQGTAQPQSAGSTPQAAVTVIVETPTPVPGSPTPEPSPSPTPPPQPGWQTIQTFSAVGNQQTPTFTVPRSWRLLWSCDASGGQFILSADIYNADTSYYAVGAIFTTCTPDNASGTTNEHKAGNVYLDITGDGLWTIEVQVFK